MEAVPRIRQSSEYAELKRRVRAAGLLETQPLYYWLKVVTVTILLAASVVGALFLENTWALVGVAIFFGFTDTQLGLLAHDVAHHQAFRGRRTNQVANLILGNLLLAVSYSWWTQKHNQHHATPNHMDEDPDVNFPMIVFDPAQIASKRRWLKPIIAIQAYAFITLLPFQSLNVRFHSVRHLFAAKARAPFIQGLAIVVHFALYGLLLWTLGWPMGLLFFVVHQATFGLYNSSVFASNHKGMQMVRESDRLGFLREQILTTRNVKGQPVVDFWTGGLNYQIEHHLFPSMPRNKLREAQVVVREFCAEHKIPYYETGLFRSYKEILAHLNRASASLRHGVKVPTPASAGLPD